VTRALLLLCSALLGALPAASASAAPSVHVEGYKVLGTVDLDAPPAEVLAVIRDPHEVNRISRDKTQVKSTAVGDCLQVDYLSPSFVGDVEYRARLCDTPDGSRALLAEPVQDMTEYEAVWRVVARDGGSRVDYELVAVPALALPRALVARATKGPVHKMLAALERHFSKAPAE
jgi:hypothetical protein